MENFYILSLLAFLIINLIQQIYAKDGKQTICTSASVTEAGNSGAE
jgi:hypothetical protein